MERLRERVALARQAVERLNELAFIAAPSEVERDASIQRFEYSVEAVWKATQRLLAVEYGLELASPKPVVRACVQNGLLNEEDGRTAMRLIDDRNLTSHAYNEALAVAIHSRLPEHARLLARWLDTLAQALTA